VPIDPEHHGGVLAHPSSGAVIVVAGPDGSGKSLVAERLAEEAASRGSTVRRMHHRPRVLPALTRHEGPVTDPHRARPYPPALAALKLVYLFLDYRLGWALRIAPGKRAGGTVIIERGWWDLAVDPRRYRLTELPRLHRFLGSLLPRPDRTMVLDAPEQVLLARKSELPAAELRRQRDRWQSIAARTQGVVIVDATSSVDTIVERTILADEPPTSLPSTASTAGWVGLPSPHSAHWVLPRSPARLSRNSLKIHRPVSRRALAGWCVGYGMAASGVLRLCPAVTPEGWILDRTTDLVPVGGSLAVARSNHRDRALVLVLDRRGTPFLVAKLAHWGAAAEQLAAEAAAISAYGPLVEPPLRLPVIRAADLGRLVFEALPWRVDLTPWRLDPLVAYALGRLHAVHRAPDGTGVAHGDVAPWNLLRVPGGWSLLDWEAAGPGHPPFYDLFHFLVQSHALLGRPTSDDIVKGLRGNTWIGRCLQAYAIGGGVDLRDSTAYLRAYLRGAARSDRVHSRALRARRAREALAQRLLAGVP
jgi:thymidylate kinase